MKRQTVWFRVVSVFALTVGLLTWGHALHSARAQERLPLRHWGRLRAEAASPSPGADASVRTESATIGGVKVSVWRPPARRTAPAPLVVFSHGFGGSSTQSTFLMKALAGAGYLVVAPNHKDAGAFLGMGVPAGSLLQRSRLLERPDLQGPRGRHQRGAGRHEAGPCVGGRGGLVQSCPGRTLAGRVYRARPGGGVAVVEEIGREGRPGAVPLSARPCAERPLGCPESAGDVSGRDAGLRRDTLGHQGQRRV